MSTTEYKISELNDPIIQRWAGELSPNIGTEEAIDLALHGLDIFFNPRQKSPVIGAILQELETLRAQPRPRLFELKQILTPQIVASLPKELQDFLQIAVLNRINTTGENEKPKFETELKAVSGLQAAFHNLIAALGTQTAEQELQRLIISQSAGHLHAASQGKPEALAS